ncbi:MAG TPA: hypothetical protein ENG74_02080 [Thermoplasmatales archaeon]|nr:hypothetical protein [Thermoplasmatales archaeon]
MYRYEICENLIEVIHGGSRKIYCCGQPLLVITVPNLILST